MPPKRVSTSSAGVEPEVAGQRGQVDDQALALAPTRVGPAGEVASGVERGQARSRAGASPRPPATRSSPAGPRCTRGRRGGRGRGRRPPGSRASIRSHASIHRCTGPAHTIGWPPWNTRSPVNRTPASGRCTVTSPRVWAGPSSSSWTARSPTLQVERAVEGGGGRRDLDAVEGEARRRSAAGRRRPRRGSGPPSSSAASVDGRHLVHLPRAGRRGDDLGAGHQLVAVAVVAVGVRVHERADPRGRGRHGPQVLEHPSGEGEVEQRVDEQRCVAVGDEPGVRPAPAAVGLQVGPRRRRRPRGRRGRSATAQRSSKPRSKRRTAPAKMFGSMSGGVRIVRFVHRWVRVPKSRRSSRRARLAPTQKWVP